MQHSYPKGPAMVSRGKLMVALLFLNLAVFVLAVTYLPRTGTYSYTGPISQFINARTDWGMAWATLAASACASVAVYVLLAKDESGDPPANP